MLQYWSERICAAIGDISTIQWAIYCKIGAKYSAHPKVYAICTVVATYTMLLQFRIFRLQYSTERICAAIGDISTTQWALHLKFGAKYSAHHPVYAMCTVLPTYPILLHFRIFRTQYSTERICAAIGYMPTFLCALYCKFGTKYSARPQVHAMWTVFPDIYNEFTAPHIQASTFSWTYLRSYWIYADISVRVELQIWCQIQRTSSISFYVNCGLGHIQYLYSSAYSCFNIELNVSALLLEISRQFNEQYTARLVPNTGHILQFKLCVLWSRHIQYYYSSAYSGLNIQLNVSALLLEISGQFSARYTAIMVPNTAHVLRFTLCELWTRIYTIHLQLRTFRIQYSSERICAAIGNISTIQCSLYCKFGAKYSAHPPVYAMWSVVPDIHNAATSPYIQASIYKWKYLLWYWIYIDNSMCVIWNTWCQTQRTSSTLRYLNCAPGHIQCNYSSAYSGFNIHLNLPALVLVICRHLDAPYTAILVAYIAHNNQFALCELWSRPYAM
jgi:hypothetical protein